MQRIIILSILIISLASCRRDDSVYFDSVVYKSDNVNNDLPRYSELGLNTFGAYYNDTAWVSDATYAASVDHYINDTLRIVFNGSLRNRNAGLGLLILVVNNGPLTDLNDRKISLPDPNISFQINNVPFSVESGSFYFKKCKKLLVDGLQIGTTFSGTFDLSGKVASKSVALTNGRFDFFNTVQ